MGNGSTPYGWLLDMFRQIIRGAKNFLQEVIFKFKLPPKPVPKIDLQEWKDMQKVMGGENEQYTDVCKRGCERRSDL